MAPLIDLDDIQGNVLRGYRRLGDVRYFLVSINSVAGGRQLLDTLLHGTETVPAIETAAEWDEHPTACVNVSLTFPGLQALGVADVALRAFPAAFQQGSAARSTASADDANAPWSGVGIGDIGDSAPEHWLVGGPQNPVVHLVISVFTDEATNPARESVSAGLREVFTACETTEITVRDGSTFPGAVVHFGYRDGIAQPQMEGRPGLRRPDLQPNALTGDFLLGRGFRNSFQGNYLGAIPAALGDNGTYMAFRILRQDVRVFEEYIRRTGSRFDMEPELVAAKLVGRWRNGVPLSVSPNDDLAPLTDDQLNAFDHAATIDHPANFDDSDGVRCPFGAHIRRMNPRGGPVIGIQHNRRIIRRGVPYGPQFTYDPAVPDDGIERGLLGAFMCGDLAAQFEFLQKVWSNMDISAPMLRGSRDPIIGWQPDGGGRFSIPTGDSRGVLTAHDVPRLVTTRGSLYLFMPGIGGLRTLATGGG